MIFGAQHGIFELRLLDAVGYRPQLFRCVRCSKEIEPVDNFFGIDAGGVLCPDCVVSMGAGPRAGFFGRAHDRSLERPALRDAQAGYETGPSAIRPLSVSALKLLRFMQREPSVVVQRLNIRRETHAEMERLMNRYLTHLLERELKSVKFLGTLPVTSNQ